MPSLPKVSCLTVTHNRLLEIKQAVRGYCTQDYPNRELIIVTDGPPFFQEATKRFLNTLGRNDIRIRCEPSTGITLGAMRNLSLDFASGDVICQWDDDDLYGPKRLSRQVHHLLDNDLGASCLVDQLQFFVESRELFWIDWSLEGNDFQHSLLPGTVTAFRNEVRYPEDGETACKGEDSAYLDGLYATTQVGGLKGSGDQYIYVYHGANTFDKNHHRAISERYAAPVTFLAAHETALWAAVAHHQLPGPITVKTLGGEVFNVFDPAAGAPAADVMPRPTVEVGEAQRTICLCMIVKDESEVIERCLSSVRDIIDYWVVCDTGSTDHTPTLVEAALADIPGELHRHQWVDFGYNRTEAMALARERADYVLVVDADMIVNVHGAFKHALDADAYLLRYEGALDYQQPMLFRASLPWRFVGATHEYAYAEGSAPHVHLAEVSLLHLADGSQRSDKFERDVELLRRSIDNDASDGRAMFYLAQSYRESGFLDEAEHWYRKRADVGGWDEEVWYALYQIGCVQQTRGDTWPKVLDSFLAAYAYRPSRLEALYPIVRHYRLSQQYELAYLFGGGLDFDVYPVDTLFIEKAIYEYELPMEVAISAFWVGKHGRAIELYNKLLDLPDLPPSFFETCLRNRRFSLEEIAPRPTQPIIENNRIRVVVPFHNAGCFLDNCVASLLSQDYGHFEVLFIDDGSTDGCWKEIPNDPRFEVLHNDSRQGGAYSLHTALTQSMEPDTIVVILDGDDCFACRDALTHIDGLYRATDCWVTYGQFRYSNGAYGIAKPYASREAFSHARDVWYAAAPRTFRVGLYHRLGELDPDYSFMKDANGQWFTSTMDMALIYPIIEVAGYDRVCFNDRPIYVYNVDNPLNVHKVDRDSELRNNLEIVQKTPFEALQSYRAE